MKVQLLLTALLAAFLGIFASSIIAAPHTSETVTFKVSGNCSMCKKTIETALKKNPAVKKADWNVETKMIKAEYDPAMISLKDIHRIIAETGYDTEKVKAPDNAYDKLPSCCRYRKN